MSKLPFESAFQSLTKQDHPVTTHSHNNQYQPMDSIKQDDMINTSILSKQIQKNYFTQFRSMAIKNQFNNKEEIPVSINAYQTGVKESRINAICNIKEPAIVFRSKIGSKEEEYVSMIREPAFYSFKESNAAFKENVERINNELGREMRSCFKNEKKDSEEILDLKYLDFQTYAKAIVEKYNNQLMKSFLKTNGSLSIDQQIYLPERYQVKQKKVQHNFGTQTSNQYTTETPKPQFTKTALMKLDIQKIKSRVQRNSQYFQIMQQKLVKFFNYVLKDDPSNDKIPTVDKIKYVLSNLQNYKHQQCDEQSKITLLVFFFKQFHTLKQQKQKLLKQIQQQKRNQQETKRQHSMTPKKKTKSFQTQQKFKEEDWMK